MPPGPLFRLVLLIGGIAAVVTGWLMGAPEATAKRTPCPPARYVVLQGAEQIIGEVTPRPAFLAVESGRVALGACSLVVARAPKAKRNGATTLSANAATCGSF